MAAKKKILFVAEAVTLAHVGRPLALAATLDRERYEVHFACAKGYDFCFEGADLVRWPLHSIPNTQFLQALADGKPVYDAATLEGYVEEDLRLLREIKPDVVVGPTVAGIRAGRDEVLDRAVAWVRANVPERVVRSR